MPRNVRTRGTQTIFALAAALVLVGCSDPSPDAEPLGGPVPDATASETPSTADPTSNEPDEPSSDPPTDFTEVTIAETIVSGLHTPWDVAFLEDGAALVPLRDSGQVLRIDGDEVTELDGGGPDGAIADVHHDNESGMLGVAVGPDQSVYLYYTTSTDNRVVRMDLEGDALVDPEVILDGIPSASNHNGGRIAFGPDGYLYVTTGDVRETHLAQDTDSLAGKILRITAAGDPAPDNPFENEVWSYGHRNVQGLGWTSDGTMYASEFGSGNYDELNLIEPGNNYGWPAIEGWAGDPEYTDPLVTWTTEESSPSGIAVTDSGIWVAGLRGERLWYVPRDEGGTLGEPRDYLDIGRLRAVTTSPDGELWVVTSNTDGRGEPEDDDDRIVRIETN